MSARRVRQRVVLDGVPEVVLDHGLQFFVGGLFRVRVQHHEGIVYGIIGPG